MKNGNLAPGMHLASLAQIEQRFTHTEHRKKLFEGLKKLSSHLKEAGCNTLFVDGSFITNKEVPGDYDALWDPAGVTNKIDPDLLQRNRIEQRREKYLGDVFVHVPELGGFPHLKHFQEDKDDLSPKGIIKVDLRKPI